MPDLLESARFLSLPTDEQQRFKDALTRCGELQAQRRDIDAELDALNRDLGNTLLWLMNPDTPDSILARFMR